MKPEVITTLNARRAAAEADDAAANAGGGPPKRSVRGLLVALIRMTLFAVSIIAISVLAFTTIRPLRETGPHPFDGLFYPSARSTWPAASEVTLTSKSPLLRAVAAREIRRHPTESTPDSLRSLLEHDDPFIRCTALELIGDLGYTALLTDVATLASSGDADTRAHAIWALGCFGEEAMPTLLTLIRNEPARPSVELAFERLGEVALTYFDDLEASGRRAASSVSDEEIALAREWSSRGMDCAWSTTSDGLAIRIHPREVAITSGMVIEVECELVNISARTLRFFAMDDGRYDGRLEIRNARGETPTIAMLEDPAGPRGMSKLEFTYPGFESLLWLEPGERHPGDGLRLAMKTVEYWPGEIADGGANFATKSERGPVLVVQRPLMTAPLGSAHFGLAVEKGELSLSYTFGEFQLDLLVGEANYAERYDRWIGLVEINRPTITIKGESETTRTSMVQ